ncbi:hypothetical protein TNCV_4138011 [Trichonephila clavipes]|nr:hypothetical protein TNCV_4138011 [Trichonephila clavipes]
MMLLPSDDLGSGPRTLKAIRSKGAPTLYSCSLSLVRFLSPLRAAQDHMCDNTFPRYSAHCSDRSTHEIFVRSS